MPMAARVGTAHTSGMTVTMRLAATLITLAIVVEGKGLGVGACALADASNAAAMVGVDVTTILESACR